MTLNDHDGIVYLALGSALTSWALILLLFVRIFHTSLILTFGLSLAFGFTSAMGPLMIIMAIRLFVARFFIRETRKNSRRS